MTENPFVTPGYNPDVRQNAEDRSDAPRDQYGRYLVKLPGMEHMPSAPSVPLTRVSTVTKALIQKKSLIDWRERLILEAMADADPGIMAGLKQAKANGDRKQLMKIGEELFKRGGGKERSQLGTAMHLYTEKRNRGEDPGSMPEEHKPSLKAYDTLIEGRVRVLPQFLERRLIAPWSAGGTLDNVVMYRNDLVQPENADPDNPAEGEWDMRVADLKTGRDLSKGWPEKLIQLWEYANAEYFWDEDEARWVRPPRELRKDRGLIIHVPMDGTAHLYDVDLTGMEAVVEAAMIARRHEAEAHTKAHLVSSVDMRGPAYVAPVLQPGSMANSVQHGAETTAQLEAAIESARVELDEPIPPLVENRGLLTADGSGPLAPLAEAGKRGCGVCGRIGHKRNSPKCWGENDPATGKAAQDGPSVSTVEEAEAVPDPMTPAEDEFSDQMVNGAPYTSCPGHGAGWTNRGDGVFVCAQCGLPSAKVATTLNEAVQAGQFPAPAPVDPKLSDPAATVPDGWSDWVAMDLENASSIRAVWNIRDLAGPENRNAWRDEVHGVLARERAGQLLRQDIDQAGTASEVLAIRDAAISLGAWVPAMHDSYGRSRWEALMTENKR